MPEPGFLRYRLKKSMKRKPAPKPRGGAREGAGRKTPDGASGMTRRTVMLDAESYQRLLKLGDGNLSAGVRIAARRLT